ncbi:hypothetical protein FTO74_04405 [Granulicella sp. WH15]|uniref:pilus assembly protein TadG-related protein n=1 Tax=Granulicella sp. WH15 TaxID=2602070 RepID=UPI001366A8F8|nr:pilus assembly protein TadG-related protein [Granulicella sp. WH15]QHN02696.1 hypothetical protein FTO74_04405 [Granulicella sp. WH15]
MTFLKKLSDESGQVIVVAALCLVVMIAFVGLAVDVGHVRYAKRNLQNAADAAALAAAMEVRVCGGTANCPAMQAAAQSALVENGYAGSLLLTNCSGLAGAALTLTLNNGPCALGASDPNTGKLSYAEVVVSQQLRTYFAKIVGFDNVPISARAEAAHGLGGPCIYALDPSGPGAITVVGGVGFTSTCAIVDESTSDAALACVVGLGISAPKISVSGGAAGLLCGSTPPPTLHVPPPSPADPLAYLPAPTGDACPSSSSGPPYYGSATPVNLTLPLLANIVFNPGVYCGGISITASLLSSITFNPGTYILKDGHSTILGIPQPTTGGLQINIGGLLSSISGSNVLFYNESTSGGFSVVATSAIGGILPLGSFNLSANTQGEYAGILFFQAHGNTAPGTFVASLVSPSNLSGAIYMPDAQLNYAVGVITPSYNILVARDITFTAQILSTVGSNYATLQSGSPVNGDNAVLVQ